MLKLAQARHADLLLDAVADGLALFDGEDRLVCCNHAYLNLLGASEESSVLGRTALELLDTWLPSLMLNGDADYQRLRRLHETPHEQSRVSFDVRTKDGQRLRVTDRRAAAGGRVRTVWNLTGGIRAPELENEGTLAQEGASTAALNLLSAMNRKLLKPLNAMLGFTQLMHADRREPLPLRHRARLEGTLQAGEHLAALIDEALDFAQLEAGRAPLTLEPVDPLAVLREVVSTLERSANHRGSSVWLEAPPGEVPPVLVDLGRFTRILRHFGANAVKYNRPNGAIRVCVSLPTPDRVRVSVHDNGDGIPAERQAHLFRSFEQCTEGGMETASTSTGLIVAKRLADLMGAAVGVNSRPGAGSEFWLEVPVA